MERQPCRVLTERMLDCPQLSNEIVKLYFDGFDLLLRQFFPGYPIDVLPNRKPFPFTDQFWYRYGSMTLDKMRIHDCIFVE